MKKTFTQSGFTLIELISSLFIIIAILQVFLFISANVNQSAFLRNNLIAANLSQEGIEVVRNIRDQDWFLGKAFGTSLPTGSWRVQWNSTSLLPLSGNSLLRKDLNGIFSYDQGSDTIFRREIDITNISSSEMKVVSTVNWEIGSNDKTVSAEVHLFNWHRP